jgi:hypothetical protein
MFKDGSRQWVPCRSAAAKTTASLAKFDQDVVDLIALAIGENIDMNSFAGFLPNNVRIELLSGYCLSIRN